MKYLFEFAALSLLCFTTCAQAQFPTGVQAEYRFPPLAPQSLADCTCKQTCVPVPKQGCDRCIFCRFCRFGLQVPAFQDSCARFCKGSTTLERTAFCEGICTHGSPDCATCAKNCPAGTGTSLNRFAGK